MLTTSTAARSKKTRQHPAAGNTKPDVVGSEDDWECELDILGRHAPLEELQRHLDRAPNPESAGAQLLAGYIYGIKSQAA